MHWLSSFFTKKRNKSKKSPSPHEGHRDLVQPSDLEGLHHAIPHLKPFHGKKHSPPSRSLSSPGHRDHVSLSDMDDVQNDEQKLHFKVVWENGQDDTPANRHAEMNSRLGEDYPMPKKNKKNTDVVYDHIPHPNWTPSKKPKTVKFSPHTKTGGKRRTKRRSPKRPSGKRH